MKAWLTAGMSTPSSRHLMDTKTPPYVLNQSKAAGRSPPMPVWYSMGRRPPSVSLAMVCFNWSESSQ